MNYTLDQIKQAFWDTFHKSGELWFEYLGSEEEAEMSTFFHWDDFLHNLLNPSNPRKA